MKKTIITICLTLVFGIVNAQDVKMLNGDFNRDGKITEADVTTLVKKCIAKESLIAGKIVNKEISIGSVTQYTPSATTFLMGDMNGDGRITIGDITNLVAQINHPEKYHYAAILDGKIVQGYLVGQMFIQIGEDNFIDDGEVEF